MGKPCSWLHNWPKQHMTQRYSNRQQSLALPLCHLGSKYVMPEANSSSKLPKIQKVENTILLMA